MEALALEVEEELAEPATDEEGVAEEVLDGEAGMAAEPALVEEPLAFPRVWAVATAGAHAKRNAQRPAVARRRLLFTIEFRHNTIVSRRTEANPPSARCT